MATLLPLARQQAVHLGVAGCLAVRHQAARALREGGGTTQAEECLPETQTHTYIDTNKQSQVNTAAVRGGACAVVERPQPNAGVSQMAHISA